MIFSSLFIGVLSLLSVRSFAKSTVALRGGRRITTSVNHGGRGVNLGAIFRMMFQKADVASARTMDFDVGETLDFLPNCDWTDMLLSTSFGCSDCEKEEVGVCFDLSCSRDSLWDMTWDCEACGWDSEDDEADASKLCGKSTCDMLKLECRDCEDLTWGGEDCASCDWCEEEIELTFNCTNVDLAAPYYECDGSWPETFWSADEDVEDEAGVGGEDGAPGAGAGADTDEDEDEDEGDDEDSDEDSDEDADDADADEDEDDEDGDEEDEGVEEAEARGGN